MNSVIRFGGTAIAMGTPTLSDKVLAVLDAAQNGRQNESKLVKSLKKMEEEADPQDFFVAIMDPLKRALLVPKKEPAVERCLKLIAHYAALGLVQVDDSSDDDEENPNTFHMLLLNQLLAYHQARNKSVRLHSCQLVAMIVDKALTMVDENYSVPGELWDAIQTNLLKRLYDRVPAIRAQAVYTLQRLQNPEDLECPVVTEYLHLLECDSAAEVRKAALACVCVNKKTLAVIMQRTRDVNDTIRQQAYKKLAENCTIRHLTISQRVQLLKDGLQDRSKVVQEACICNLLRSWSATVGDDFLQLLHCLDVEASSEVAELALNRLFAYIDPESLVESMLVCMAVTNLQGENKENSPLSPLAEGGREEGKPANRVVPLDILSSETAFFWRCLCKHLRSLGDSADGLLERIVPSLSEYCAYLKQFHREVLASKLYSPEEPQSVFIAGQLFSILESMDFSDEVGRRNLAGTAVSLLTSSRFPASLVSNIMALQAQIWPQPSVRIEKVLEVIAEVGQPLDGTMLNSSTIMTDTPDLSQASPLEEAECDSDTLLKCLTLTSELLRKMKPQKLPSNLQMLCETLILPSIHNEDPYVRDSALNCLGLISILDREQAAKYFYLFVQVSQIDHEGVQATALKVVCDLLLLYGFEAFKSSHDDGGISNDDSAKIPQADSDPPDSSTNATQEIDESVGREGRDSADESDKETSMLVVEDNEDETTEKVLDMFLNVLDSESALLRGTVGEGLAKLLLSGRVVSRRVLAKLILLWYNPVMQDEDRLRGALGVFFQAFAAQGSKARELVCDVFVPVLRTVLLAPPSSPLSTVNANNIVDLLVHLTTVKGEGQAAADLHSHLAVCVANEALKIAADPSVRVYCRALSLLDTSRGDKNTVSAMKVLIEDLLDNVADHISKRYLEKLKLLLSTEEETTEEGEAEAEEEKERKEDEGIEQTDPESRSKGDSESEDQHHSTK